MLIMNSVIIGKLFNPTFGPCALLRYYLRHGLKDGFDAVSKSELIDNLLLRLVKVNLPGVFAVRLGQLHLVIVLIRRKKEIFIAK